ncbi:hypothetical protein C8J57DRAFT_435344 [Mycena rebaudengoi]|nr:hypothetical protein C8J57DRAFT_435344 [Mycena rebaudengoi]
MTRSSSGSPIESGFPVGVRMDSNQLGAGRRSSERIQVLVDTDGEGSFARECEDTAEIWKLYMVLARIGDENLTTLFNSDLDPLLIFAGLFSAILSAFLIEVRKGLQEDLQSITNTLLLALIENQRNTSSTQIPSTSRFEPSSSSRFVNGFWFSSLLFSLVSALGASLAKGWVTQFSSPVSGTTWGDAAVHCRRLQGRKRWHLELIIQSLPVLIHIAFFLFSIGLVVVVMKDDITIGIVVLVLTALIVVFYCGSSLHSAYTFDSPFRTPLSGLIRHLLAGSLGMGTQPGPVFPVRKDTQKALALAWLVAEAPDLDTLNAGIRAIAALPVNLFVQEQLLSGRVVDALCRNLSAQVADCSPDTDTTFLEASLYALLHLVQGAPSAEHSLGALRDLISHRGPLFATDTLPVRVKELALCIKGRILLFLRPDIHQATLYDTDIPILLKSCSDPHLRSLLMEVLLLAGAFTDKYSQQTSHTSFAILRDPSASNRNEIHAELVKAALSKEYVTQSIAKFCDPTLMEGLNSGSRELQRRYAKAFDTLSVDPTFRLQFSASTPAAKYGL